MLGLGGAAVTRRTPLQPSDQIIIQITHMQVPSYQALRGTERKKARSNVRA